MSDPIEQNPVPSGEGLLAAKRQLAMERNGHRYTFQYRPGEEVEVLETLSAMAGNPDHDIGWYEAAVLSHGVGVGLREMLEELVKH